LRDKLHARAYEKNLLLRVLFEITNRCNLRCYHCYVTGSADELGTERVLTLLDEFAAEGCMYLTLTGGEVGVRDDFLTIARGVKERRMTLGVLTNGTTFSREQLDELVALKPGRVSVSIYGGTAKAHEKVTGVPGSFARSLATVRYLREHGVACEVHSVLMRGNFDEFANIADLASSMDCVYRFDPTVAPRADGDASVLEHRVSSAQLREFYMHMFLREKTLEGRLVDSVGEVPSRTPGNCGAGVVSAYVAANGDVYPCMGFAPAFGNVAAKPFTDVWRGSAAATHRRAMGSPLVVCNRCDLVDYCTVRCPRLAVAEDGDICGPSRRACELAAMVKEMRNVLHQQKQVC
jgi:radical SAM protein with 4Fe4S-binding SPASM domain